MEKERLVQTSNENSPTKIPLNELSLKNIQNFPSLYYFEIENENTTLDLNDERKKEQRREIFTFICILILFIVICSSILFLSFTSTGKFAHFMSSFNSNLTDRYYIPDDVYANNDHDQNYLNYFSAEQSKELKPLYFSEEDKKNIIKFFTISDLHIDLEYSFNSSSLSNNNNDQSSADFSLGQFDFDSPLSLLSSLFRAMKTVEENPSFILFAGDMIRHKQVGEEIFFETFEQFNKIFKEHFPNTALLPVIGNHDLFPFESFLEISPYNEYLSFVADQIAFSLPSDALNSFRKAAFYSVLLPLPSSSSSPLSSSTSSSSSFDSSDEKARAMFIAINNIIYTVDWLEKCSEINSKQYCKHQRGNDPFGQFDWLSSQLLFARENNLKVIIGMHFGIGRSKNGKVQWEDDYQKTFIEILSEYDEVISTLISGHSHRDFFRILPLSLQKKVSAMEVGSLTPIDGTNPSFRYFYFNSSSSQMIDYQQFYFDLPSFINLEVKEEEGWKEEYVFSEEYGVKPTAEGFIHLYNDLTLANDQNDLSNEKNDLNYSQIILKKFQEYYTARSGKSPPSLRQILCSIVNIFNSDSAHCFH